MRFHRLVACALFLAMLNGGAYSASPTPDPDAKGTISITTSGVGTDGTSITASGSLTTVTGWSTGTVTLYASLNIGGRIRSQVATVTNGSWSGSIPNVPNGTYTIWVYQTLQQSGQPDQLVGSALGSVTVNTTGNTNVEVHGGAIAFGQGQPARTNGNAGMGGSGLYLILPGYQIDTGSPPINVVTIPKDGGVVRQGAAPTVGTAGTWSNANVSVPSSLTYNVVATMAVRPLVQNPPNPDKAHIVASQWAVNK